MYIELTEEQQKPEPLPPPPLPLPVPSIPEIPIQIPSGRTASLDDSSDEMSVDKRSASHWDRSANNDASGNWDRSAANNDISANWDRSATNNDNSSNWDRTTNNDISSNWDRTSNNDVSTDPRHVSRRRDSSNGARRSDYNSRSENKLFVQMCSNQLVIFKYFNKLPVRVNLNTH